MQTWDLAAMNLEPFRPEILASDDEGRAVAGARPARASHDEKQHHQRAWVVVAAGRVEIESDDGEVVSGSTGLLAGFDPNERHEVRALEDSRLLLVLSPWPGVGHPSRTD